MHTSENKPSCAGTTGVRKQTAETLKTAKAQWIFKYFLEVGRRCWGKAEGMIPCGCFNHAGSMPKSRGRPFCLVLPAGLRVPPSLQRSLTWCSASCVGSGGPMSNFLVCTLQKVVVTHPRHTSPREEVAGEAWWCWMHVFLLLTLLFRGL